MYTGHVSVVGPRDAKLDVLDSCIAIEVVAIHQSVPVSVASLSDLGHSQHSKRVQYPHALPPKHVCGRDNISSSCEAESLRSMATFFGVVAKFATCGLAQFVIPQYLLGQVVAGS